MFQNNELNVDQTIRIKALAWTVGIHLLLLLLFFFVRYAVPKVLPTEELGIEVNIGNSNDGSGDDQPMNIDAPAAEVAVSAEIPAASQANEKELMETDEADAPVIKNVAANHSTTNGRTNEIKPTHPLTHTNVSSTPTKQPAQQRPKFIYSGANGKGGNSAAANHNGTSEGNTTGNGDRGVIGGTPGSSNYTGSPGNGTGGISHTLSGRDISPKRFTADFNNEKGTVVIRVKVDRQGNIISKSIKSSPSSTLSKIALQQLSQAKFSPSPNAAPEQFGEITIVFKTR